MVMMGFNPSFLRFLAARLLLLLLCPLALADEVGGGFWASGGCEPFIMMLLFVVVVLTCGQIQLV